MMQARNSLLVLLAAWAGMSCHTSQTRSSGPEGLAPATPSMAASAAPRATVASCDQRCPVRSLKDKDLGWTNVSAPLLDASHAYVDMGRVVQMDRDALTVQRAMTRSVDAMVDAGDAIITCRNDWRNQHNRWDQYVIERIPKAGGQPTQLAETGDCGMTRAGRYLYFERTLEHDSELARVPLEGGQVETVAPFLLKYAQSELMDYALVGNGDDVYWLAGGKILRWRNEAYEEVAVAPHAVGLAVLEGKLYYADHTRIWSVDKDGHSQVVVNFHRATQLSSDGRFLYWLEQAIDFKNRRDELSGEVMRFDPSTGAVATLFTKGFATKLTASPTGVIWTARNGRDAAELYLLDACDCHHWSTDVPALRRALEPSYFDDSFYLGKQNESTIVFTPDDLSVDEQSQLIELGMTYEHELPRDEPNIPERFRPNRSLAVSALDERYEAPITSVAINRDVGCEHVTLEVRLRSTSHDDSPVIAPLKAPPIVKPKPVPSDPKLVASYNAAVGLFVTAAHPPQGPMSSSVNVRFGRFPAPYVALVSAVFWSDDEAFSFLFLGDANGAVSQVGGEGDYTSVEFGLSLDLGADGIDEVMLQQNSADSREQSLLSWVGGAPEVNQRERIYLNAE